MNDLAQLFGLVMVAAVGAAGLFIVANELHWCDYGRATLFWFAMYQWFFAATRALLLFDVIGREMALIINTIGASVFLSILLNLIVIHVLWHRSGLAQKGGVT